jgi:ribosomal protein S18 acetylase RimI-like enzyme
MVSVRRATESDAPAVAGLLRELGYSMSPPQVTDKITLLSRSAADAIFVATDGQAVCGCLSAHVAELFHAPGRIGRITALVVAEAARRKGIGQMLDDAAMRYFVANGCVKVEVTSGAHRADAHAFYEKRGFKEYRRRYVREIAT